MKPFVLPSLLAALVASLSCASAPPAGRSDADRVAERQRRRAVLQLEVGEYAAAVATLDTLTAKLPKEDGLFTMLGDARRGAGDFEGAVRAYEQAIRLNYGASEPHMKLGVLLMENGKTGRAVTEFEVAVKFGETDPLTHYNYGLALHELGRGPEALAQWRIASERDPSNPEFAAALGVGLAGVNDSLAVECFRKAELLGQKGGAFYNNYALALERIGGHEESAARFEAAVGAAEGDERNRYRRNLARHYLRVGRNDDAEREFDALVAADGGKWSDTVYLARARLALGRFDGAIDALEGLARDVESGKIPRDSARIDRMPPELDEALDLLGMAWRGKGNLPLAVDYLKRAVALRPDDPVHLNNYGVVLAESGMLTDARAQWQRVLEIDPANATARDNLSAFGP